MATTPNGRHNGYVSHSAHLFDALSDQVLRVPSPNGPIDVEEGRSGRWFVLTAIAVLAALWLVLFLFFRDWRARYNARAAFGATQVAPVVDQFKTVEPPGVARSDWLDAVDQTRALVLSLTTSNLASIDQMKALRVELSERLDRARARPETAVAELAAVWDSLAARAGFLLREARADDGAGHVRPSVFPPLKAP